MSKHSDHHHEHHHGQHSGKAPHKDWRLWAVVLLALVAMLAYVLSDDEAIQPGSNVPAEQTPADAAP